MNSENYRHGFKFGLKQKVTIRQLSIRGVIFSCEWKAECNFYGVRYFSDSGEFIMVYYPEDELEEIADDN